MNRSNYFYVLWAVAFMTCIAQFNNVYAQSPSGVLLSRNRPVSVSSVESSTYPGANAVDASTTTKWSSSSSGFNQYLIVDLGAVYDINNIIIDWADGRYATTFDVMVSKDTLAGWQTIKTFSGADGTSKNLKGLYVDARYVKFNGRGRANPSGYRISNFSVYGHAVTTVLQKSELNTLAERILARYATRSVSASAIAVYLDSMSVNGSWPAINYASNSDWPKHVSRLQEMALAYNKPGNVYYHSSAMKDKIASGLGFLRGIDLYDPAISWYTTVISIPQQVMTTLLIMKNNIPKDSLMLYSTYLVDNTPNPSYRGRNRTWVAGITVHKGCIEDRHPIANTGYSEMASCLDAVTATGSASEGLKSDDSFHQHNSMLYSGGYGLSFPEEMAYYLRFSDGLSYGNLFSSQRRQNLADNFLGGLQLLSYKKYMDFGSAGRYISRRGAMIITSTAMLDTMKINDPSNALAYENWKNHINGTASFSADYLGAKYFWKSAILTSHGSNFYMSAKIISSRTYGTESINGENKKGYNLPLGATNIMRTGEEYKDIYPVWDWTRIPGVTAELNGPTNLTNGFKGTNNFGGGLSRGEDGIIAYEHDYRSIKASKAYFFMNNQMICLGAGISGSKSNDIITSVDQSVVNGDVKYNSGTTQTFTADSLTATSIKWIHHNNVGYLFPNGTGQLTLLKKNQTGKWSDIGTGTTSTQTKNVFSTYFRHSNTPSNRQYIYVVVPDVSITDMATIDTAHHYSFPRNESDIQAVRYDGLNKIYALVFYDAGSINMGDGVIISSNQKALVFVKEYSTNYRVSVADPVYTQGTITIKINKQLSGSGASYADGETTINFGMPTGDSAGKTVTVFLTKDEALLDNNKISSVNSESNGVTNNAAYSLSNNKAPDGATTQSVKVYPNPAKDFVTVDFTAVKSTNAKITLFDMMGRPVQTVQAVAGVGIVPTAGLTSGTYYVQVSEYNKVIYRCPLIITH